MKAELPEHIGKYPVIRRLGRGATSSVYLARDPFTERDVAVKVFRFDALADSQNERIKHKAFLAEAALAGKLKHPHIVDILDAVVEFDHSYLVMEYVQGRTLAAHAELGSLLPIRKVAEISFTCVCALKYAFQHGVIHRDIKPGNILLSEAGQTKVSDFGASFQSRGSETTQIAGIGSPAYMSPEQIRMEDLDQRTDIYSLGVTMYRLLTGRLPYEATTQAALSYAVLNVPPTPPATLRPELSAQLDRIVMRALEKDRGERYQAWVDFGKDLSQAFPSLRLPGESASDSEKFNKLREMPFFEHFGEVALWEIVRIGIWKDVEPDTAMIREGDVGESFFVLVDGVLEVTLRGRLLATVKPGRCFGEILYFTDRVERRTTTVTTLTATTVIEIKADALRSATDACQVGFNKAVMRVLIDRLLQSNQRLVER